MDNKKQSNIIEKTYTILDCENRNKNHRFYPKDIIEKWLLMEELKNGGFDVEYALDDEDIENEYLRTNLSCAKVTSLKFEGTELQAIVKFKKNELTDKIYSGDIDPDELTVVPKGKGSVKNQKVQDDYELFGFNLVKKEESSFNKEEEKEAEEEEAINE